MTGQSARQAGKWKMPEIQHLHLCWETTAKQDACGSSGGARVCERPSSKDHREASWTTHLVAQMAWPPAIVAVLPWRGGCGRSAAQVAQPAAGEAADVLEVPGAVLLVTAALGPAPASDRCLSAHWP